MNPDSWSAWQPLPLAGPAPEPAVLAETLDGGQAFRWNRIEGRAEAVLQPPSIPGRAATPLAAAIKASGADRNPRPTSLDVVYRGQWSDCLAEIRLESDRIEWRAPAAIETRVAAAIGPYFAAGHDFHALADGLPWRSDAHLAACLQAFPGLRLLRQPFGEVARPGLGRVLEHRNRPHRARVRVVQADLTSRGCACRSPKRMRIDCSMPIASSPTLAASRAGSP